jgi:UDP-N-acetyl-D-glucosamine/UDP-N-acetyl-D-galactosamine dehydrogenase
MSEKIAVLGLGYVGLPLLTALARKFDGVVGFDIDVNRVKALQTGHDWTDEISAAELNATKATITADTAQLANCSFIIVTVPTPIDEDKRPDLTPVMGACKTIAAALRGRTNKTLLPLIVFESTVWPGLTEEICGPEIAQLSGLKHGADFVLGYSPERINPGDKQHRLETITKVIAAENPAALARMEAVYGAVITAGLHKAANIRVAEAAKVLENTQRDLNVALMNELALICDRMNIRTTDVLAAAGTKWNFLKFTPGLVGGHCIGVDPYYLTTRAEELGYNPQVILSGRRINDNMPFFIAKKLQKMLNGKTGARIGILGLTFKENVRDLRNSRVPDIVQALQQGHHEVLIYDPMADATQARHEYKLELSDKSVLRDLDAIVFAVPHAQIVAEQDVWLKTLRPDGVVIDIKSMLDPASLPASLRYWSL